MLLNYLKTHLRHILKSRGYAVINLTGLTIGLACAMLVLIYVRHELSYDRYHRHASEIYRLVMKQPWNVYQGSDMFNVTPGILKPTLDNEISDVAKSTRVYTWGGNLMTVQDKTFPCEDYVMVDPDFFDIFDVDKIIGDAATALNRPFTLLISRSMARRYFGEENPVGQTIQIDHKHYFTITGVFQDTPQNSHLQYHFLASFPTLFSIRGSRERVERWGSNSYQTYIRVRPGTDMATLEEQLAALMKRHRGEDETDRFIPEPLTGIHLGGNINFEISTNNDIRLIRIYAGIGFFILLIASLNYMNLATARSIGRSREVGLRKVVGASRGQLMFQFLGESLFYSVTGLLLSLGVVLLLLPHFNKLVERNLSWTQAIHPGNGLLILGIALLMGLASGAYPAVFLSAFRPSSILRGVNQRGKDRSRQLRNILVILQFIITVSLISGTLIMRKQLAYIRNKDLGFQKDHIYTVYFRDPEIKANPEIVKAELLALPGVTGATASTHLPNTIRSNTSGRWEGQDEDTFIPIYKMFVDYNTLEFFGITLAEGRQFNPEMPTDRREAYILNQAAVKTIGWENALNQKFNFSGEPTGHVIGVVKDFHYSPLHLKIEPLAIALISPDSRYNNAKYLSLRIASENISETISQIKTIVQRFTPEYPSVFRFFDERINHMYHSENRLVTSFNLFSLIAVCIACLGLFGLSSFTAEQRATEISIRKVLGATAPGIALLLTRSFLKWVLLANALAWPIAFFSMRKWLQQFAYRMDLGWDIFLLAAGISLIIALCTIGWQTVKAATALPAEVLRQET